jgi:hypothetical protein
MWGRYEAAAAENVRLVAKVAEDCAYVAAVDSQVAALSAGLERAKDSLPALEEALMQVLLVHTNTKHTH